MSSCRRVLVDKQATGRTVVFQKGLQFPRIWFCSNSNDLVKLRWVILHCKQRYIRLVSGQRWMSLLELFPNTAASRCLFGALEPALTSVSGTRCAVAKSFAGGGQTSRTLLMFEKQEMANIVRFVSDRIMRQCVWRAPHSMFHTMLCVCIF